MSSSMEDASGEPPDIAMDGSEQVADVIEEALETQAAKLAAMCGLLVERLSSSWETKLENLVRDMDKERADTQRKLASLQDIASAEEKEEQQRVF